MMKRNLAFYCSPTELYPSFVIPVFSTPGENRFCVQDLSPSGTINGFARFNPDHFYSVNALPPAMSCSVGDQGVTAFWLDENTVFVGTFDALRLQLSQIDETELPPFVAVEAMTLVGDNTRLARAADAAATLLSGRSAVGYQKRIIDRQKLVKLLSSKENKSKKSEQDETLNDVIAKLHIIQKPDEWFYTWNYGWRKFGNDRRIFDIARWRIKEFSDDPYVPYIITSGVSKLYENETYDIGLSWLERSNKSSTGWGYVWNSMHNRKLKDKDKLDNLAIDHLHAQADASRRIDISYTWCSIWVKLWKSSPYRESISNSARIISNNNSKLSEPFVSMVLNTLINDASNKSWSLKCMYDWLKIPKGYSVWVESYLKYSGDINSEIIRNSGIKWLNRLGAGMNLWHDLWLHCNKFISKSESIDLATYWLLRSRKDLYKWPRVFSDTLDLLSGEPSPLLIRAAENWVNFHSGKRRNRLIEQIAKHQATAV